MKYYNYYAFSILLLNSVVFMSCYAAFPFLSGGAIVCLRSPGELLCLTCSRLSPCVSGLIDLNSPEVTVASYLIVPHSAFLFPLTRTRERATGVGVTITVDTVASFLFVDSAIFRDCGLRPLLGEILNRCLICTYGDAAFFQGRAEEVPWDEEKGPCS